MELIALMSWYMEPEANLTRAVQDAISIGCTRIIALDGKYRDYPGEHDTSPQSQHQAIRDAAGDTPCTIETLTDATEASKRSWLFQLAYQHGATPDDWLFVQDADHRIDRAQDIKPLLAASNGDVFDNLAIEHDETRHDTYTHHRTLKPQTRRKYVRLAYRAVPGLHVNPLAHWIYQDAEGRRLWGYNSIQAAGTLPIVVHNHSTNRPRKRTKARDDYYDLRAEHKVEVHWTPDHCHYCPQPWTRSVNTDLSALEEPDGEPAIHAGRVLFVCDKHHRRVQYENTRWAEATAQRLTLEAKGNPERLVLFMNLLAAREEAAHDRART